MKIRYLHVPFYFGLSILALGILFKIQHYPGGLLFTGIGSVLELTFFSLLIAEVFTSGKAKRNIKLTWGFGYCLLLFGAFVFWWFSLLSLIFFIALAGFCYLQAGRKKFITTKEDIRQITFDSF
jgi:hypothetical protein